MPVPEMTFSHNLKGGSIMYDHHMRLMFAGVLTGLFLAGCDHDPIGAIKDERKIVVFSVLNPAVRTQKLIVQQSLTFDEGQSNVVNNAEIAGISGTLTGPDAVYNIISMPAGESQSDTENTRYDTDFLWGSESFNYIIDGPPIESGKTYQLSISHGQYETAFAEATVPGPFEISEINIEPEYSLDNLILDIGDWGSFGDKYKPENFRVSWSESENAAGYWLDISVLEYDIPPDFQLDESGGIYAWPDFDERQILEIPYTEYPVRFQRTEDNAVRGFLTRGNTLEMPLDEFIQLIELPDDFEYRFEHAYRLRIHVHALNQALYNYFLEGSAAGENIGDVKTIPNLSYIENGYGIFGAAYTQSATARLYDYVLGIEYASPVPTDFLYWYYQFNDVYSLDQISNDLFSQLLFSSGSKPPVLAGPANETVLAPDTPLLLSWDPVEYAVNYVVVLKPSYLWFNPGNVVLLSETNQVEVSSEDIPYKDCRVEWYVKAISSLDNADAFVMELPPDKAPLIYINAVASPWSESRYFQTESGELAGFGDRGPTLLSPQNNEPISATGTLSWEEFEGADAYLIVISNGQNEYVIAVSEEPNAVPPFPSDSDLIEGLIGLSQFQQGAQYTFQVCALRVKSGALSFSIGNPAENSPPAIQPRYQHPSGIMQQSRWSEPAGFQIQ
jgi:hypothetical protein